MITGNSLQSHVQGWIFGVFTVPAGPLVAIQGIPGHPCHHWGSQKAPTPIMWET